MELTFLFVLGLAIGSFLNVLIDRLPQNKSIVGRSRCDYCQKQLIAKDLIPLFSFILLKGKCRYCKKRLSWRYPLVELLTGIIFVLVPFVILSAAKNPIKVGSFSPMSIGLQDDTLLLAYLGLFSCLIVIFFADWKYHIIPDQIQIILLIFSIIIIYLQGVTESLLWLNRVRDGIIVMLPILLIYLVTKGKGIGFGDVKLAFNIGFFLKIIAGFYALYFAFVSGAIFGIFLIFLKKKKLKDAIAFGPFLALGFALMIFFGQPILDFFAKFYF